MALNFWNSTQNALTWFQGQSAINAQYELSGIDVDFKYGIENGLANKEFILANFLKKKI
jgi:hypothetical protein